MQSENKLGMAIDTMNAALEAGEWTQVVQLSATLYAQAVAAGETTLAELVQDLHWIANDALAHPLAVAELMQA